MKYKLRLPILGLITVIMLGILLSFNIGCSQSNKPDIAKLPSKSAVVAQKTEVDPVAKTKEAVTEPNVKADSVEVKTEPKEQDKTVQAAPVVPGKQAEGVAVSACGDGKLLFSVTELSINQDESVFSVTKRAAAQSGIALDYRGFGPAAYITGIGSLKEFDQGPMSGWLYQVNGETPGVGCGLYKIKSGDKVEWVYTTDGKIAE
ncbi:MAG: DUF4430 domain-containing protein [Methylocystaceae bacterium]